MSDKNKSGPINKAKNKPAVVDVQAHPMGSAADERKTVILDNELENLEFDDKVWLFWNRNKSTIVACVVAVFAVVIFSGLFRAYTNSKAENLAQAYAAAASPEAREAFAKENSGTNLAGVALLENADSLYEAAKYAEAAAAYKNASEAFSDKFFAARASVGEGLSLIRAGKVEDGRKVLESLAKNTSASSYAAEASYNLGVLDFAAGKTDTAKLHFEAVLNNPEAFAWAERASVYLQKMAK